MNKIEQDLNILAQCAAQAPLPNVAHDKWKEAYQRLSDIIKKLVKEEKESE